MQGEEKRSDGSPVILLIGAGEWRRFEHLCRERIEVDCAIGYAKIGNGYLLLGTETTQVTNLPEIREIQDILLLPLEYEAAMKAIRKHKRKAGAMKSKKRRLKQIAKRKHQELTFFGEHFNILKGADLEDKSSSEDEEGDEKGPEKEITNKDKDNIDRSCEKDCNEETTEQEAPKDIKIEKCIFGFKEGLKAKEEFGNQCSVKQTDDNDASNTIIKHPDTFSSQKDSDMETLRGTEPLLSIKPKRQENRSRKSKVSEKRAQKRLKEEQKRIEKKFCKETRRIFRQGGFYTSRTAEIWQGDLMINETTGGVCTGENKQSSTHKFLWNEHLLEPFKMQEILAKDTGKDPEILAKVMRGFVGAIRIKVQGRNQTERQGKLILVSRRSAKRNGMRYLRRGVDDKGYVANFAETTQLIAFPDEKSTQIYQKVGWQWFSYRILRGSIPVFFYQDPSKLQPRPEVQRSIGENREKFERHFKHLHEIYGKSCPISCISLVDKQGKERKVGKMYEKLALEQKIPFTWFDFHKECSGLRFSNVARLYEDKTVQNGEKLQKYSSSHGDEQNGLFRINCIDCLDRTNIVVKSICERVLKKQLLDQELELVAAPSFRHEFLGLWADQGDYLSSQYASTNAMKGDFTRSERRGYTGVVNDGIISLVRFYHGFVTDYYTQVVIDFLLGNEQSDVFERYDSVLDNFDPNKEKEKELVQSMRAEKITEQLGDKYSEAIIGAWWVMVNEKSTDPFDLVDGLLILTSQNAIIDCRNAAADDFEDEEGAEHKVQSIPLGDVRIVKYGSYYTDVRSRHARRPSRNLGCELIWGPSSNPNLLRLRFPPGWRKTRKKSMLRLLGKVFVNSAFVRCDIVDLQSAQKHTAVWDLISYRLRQLIWG